MSDVVAIVPVKAFERAKSRLAPVLSAAERAELARLMAEDLLSALVGVPALDRILLLGQGPDQARLADRHGADYLADDPVLDVSGNVARACRQLPAAIADALLVLPADLPLLRPEDVAQLLRHAGRGVAICRAARDGGTNAWFAAPPKNPAFAFGRMSASRHAAAARASGQAVRVIDHPAFARDIDEPEDLAWLCRQRSTCLTLSFLEDRGVPARLSEPATASLAS